MVNYNHLSAPSPEWIQFEKTWKPPIPPANATLRDIQATANARTAELFATVLGRPDSGLNATDHEIPTTNGATVPIRLYRPTQQEAKLQPLYISFHGGGYFLGSLETEDPHCRNIALNTGLAVLNVNYRRTPEWTFPAPIDDAWAAYKWVQETAAEYNIDPSRVLVGGVSAGATLAIAVALRALKDVNPVRGLILSTPATVHPEHFPNELIYEGHSSSLTQNADAPFINATRLRNLTDMYQPDATHPDFSPLLLPSESFHGLCPTIFHIAGLDPLRDEGLLFEQKLRSAGVDTKLNIYPGIPHAFMSLPTLPSAIKWRQSMHKDLRDWAGVSKTVY